MVHGSAESTVAKLRPQGPGWSGLRPNPSGPCVGGAGGPDRQDQDLRQQSRSVPCLLLAARGGHTLATSSEAPAPKVPRLGRGMGGGSADSPYSLLLEHFQDFWWGKGALTGFEKGGGGEMNFYLSLPFFSPSFSAFHTPPPPILVEMRRGKRPQLSWKLPTLPYFRDQWEREQKGGGGTGQCI